MTCKITEELREIILGHPNTLVNTICEDCEGDYIIAEHEPEASEEDYHYSHCQACNNGILQTLEPITLSQMLVAIEKQSNFKEFTIASWGEFLVTTYVGAYRTPFYKSLGYLDKTKDIDQQSLEFKKALLKLLKNNDK